MSKSKEKYFGTRLDSENFIENFNCCKTPMCKNVENTSWALTQVLGNIGTFDSAGDFYFKNDLELTKIQIHFTLFYQNRVRFWKEIKNYNAYSLEKLSRKESNKRKQNSNKFKPYISYQKYLSKSKLNKFNVHKIPWKYLDEESAESCEILPNNVGTKIIKIS